VPLAGICCITYNHEKFIAQCIEGFLMQETTFPVEIIIHDDASTDGTVKSFELTKPNIPDSSAQSSRRKTRIPR